MRTIEALAAAAAAAVLLTLAPALAGAEGESVRLHGKIKSILDDGAAIELAAKGGPYRVSLTETPAVVTLRAKKLGAFDSGAQVHVLGRRHEAASDPNTGNSSPPTIGSIQAFIVGASFTPPAVPQDLAAKKIAWHSGIVNRRSRSLYTLGEAIIFGGEDRIVVEIAESDRAALVKNAILFLEAARPDAAKPKELSARRIYLIEPGVPAAELRFVTGVDVTARRS